jgi:hypothetical protein
MMNLVLSIIEDKKFPFTDVYVKIPNFLFQKFMEQLRESDMKYIEMEQRKDIFLLKF